MKDPEENRAHKTEKSDPFSRNNQVLLLDAPTLDANPTARAFPICSEGPMGANTVLFPNAETRWDVEPLQRNLARELVVYVRVGERTRAHGVCLGARSETGRLCLSFGGDLSGLGSSAGGSDDLVRVCVGLCL